MQPQITLEENDILLRVNKKILEEDKLNTSIETKIFICPTCNKKCSSEEVLQGHIATHKTTKCEVCNEIFSTKWQLRNHSVTHKDVAHHQLLAKDGFLDDRADLEKLFNCQICHKHFISQKHLERHIPTHTKYKCEHCAKAFKTKWQLENHSVTHNTVSSSAKPSPIKNPLLVCRICNQDFCSKYTLLVHLRSHKREKT